MRIPSVRTKLGIPALIAHDPEDLPEKKKVRASLKDGLYIYLSTNQGFIGEMHDLFYRQQLY